MAFRPQTESAVDVVKFESDSASFSVWDQHADSWSAPDTNSGSGWTTDRENDWTLVASLCTRSCEEDTCSVTVCGATPTDTAGDPDDWPLQTRETEYAYKLLYYNSGNKQSTITDWTSYSFSLGPQDLFQVINQLQTEIDRLNSTISKLRDSTYLLDSKIDTAEGRVTLTVILLVLGLVLLGACALGFFTGGWPLRQRDSEDFELGPTTAETVVRHADGTSQH